MKINLAAIIAEIIPDSKKCGVILASTALACLFYVKKSQDSLGRQRETEDNSSMRAFVRNSQTVLKLISESSFSSDIDLSCLSDYQDLSLNTSCQPFPDELYQSYFDDSFITCSATNNNKEFWQLTNISTCEADTPQAKDSHYYGLIETEEGEISYIWEP